MRYNFIVNPYAGRGRAIEVIGQLQDYMDKYDMEYRILYTERRGHATELAQSLVEEGVDNVISVGGDGTLNEIVAGIGSYGDITLGIIPAGTGNDFIRSAGMELNPIKALELIVRGRVGKIDLVDISGRLMLCFGNAGIDAKLVQIVNDSPKKTKSSYMKALLKSIVHFDWYKYNISIDGSPKVYKEGLIVAVLGGRDIASGIKICPPAKIDDGKMDIVFVGATKHKIGVLGLFASLLRGKILLRKEVEHFVCESASIELIGHNTIDIDGELIPGEVMNCKLLASAVKLYR